MSIFDLRQFASRRVWERSVKIMGRVSDYRYGNFKLAGLVLDSGRVYHYNPWIAKDGTFYCDCQGFEGAGTLCSHLVALLRKAYFEDYEIEEYIMGLRGEYTGDFDEMIYETSIEGYNKLFGGLRAGRHISGLFARPQIGKSIMLSQFMTDMALKHDASSILIDTEGGFAPEWIEAAAQRAGGEVEVVFVDWRVKVITKDRDKGKSQHQTPEYPNFKLPKFNADTPTIFIYDARNIVQIFPFFGRPQAFKVKSGVIEPIEGGGLVSIDQSPIGKIMDAADVKFVANDSLSAPLEAYFTGGMINYRTRAKATQVWLGRCQDLIDEYKCVLMNTAHATKDPTNQWSIAEPVGGKAILHNNKYIAYLRKYGNKKAAKEQGINYTTLRKMSVYRHMTKPQGEEEALMRTVNGGVIDFSLGGAADEEE